jgi:hypothetical protein
MCQPFRRRREFDGDSTGIRQEFVWNATGIRQEFDGNQREDTEENGKMPSLATEGLKTPRIATIRRSL